MITADMEVANGSEMGVGPGDRVCVMGGPREFLRSHPVQPVTSGAVGAADDERALPLLERWLSDPRWEVRTRAALALAKLDRPSSAEAL